MLIIKYAKLTTRLGSFKKKKQTLPFVNVLRGLEIPLFFVTDISNAVRQKQSNLFGFQEGRSKRFYRPTEFSLYF